MVKSTGGPGSSQLQESARYKTVYPNFPETKSRVSPFSKVWFSWGTRVLLWHKQAPLGVCYVMEADLIYIYISLSLLLYHINTRLLEQHMVAVQ